MDGVAVIAGNPFDFVPGQVPEGQIFLFAMTGKAFGRLRLGVGESLAEDEDAHASLSAFFHVGGSRTMAGLAIFLAGRAAGDGFLRMGRHHVGIEAVLMTPFADFHPHRAIARLYLKGE
jgi:hypothetical protein